MNLLEQIQSAAVDADSDLATLLRKCRLLGSRLGNRSLEDWVLWESNGYPEDIHVPDYRTWPLAVVGNFSGSFGSGLRNAPVPLACIPEKVRPNYSNYECRQSVASIEAIVTASTADTRQVSVGDLAVGLGTKVYQGQNCLQAWAEFPTGNLVELLNAVRNRILDFSLAVWKEAPLAGEVERKSASRIEDVRVTQIFNTTIHGGSANVVGTAAESIVVAVSAHDFGSLESLLLGSGVDRAHVSELQEALEAEPDNGSDGFGPRVSAWISEMMGRAASGSWKVGVGAAGNLLGQAIARYYGL